MNFWLDFRLKVRKFFREHKRVIIIIVIVWGLVIAINYFLKGKQDPVKPITTYDPHSPVMDETGKVPEEYKEPINNLIDNYINYCNNKEYENAYNLLSNEFKGKYCKTLDEFKSYVDELFDEKKIYNIQNYSNVNNVYVYQLRLLEDILATGTTDGYDYKEEKVVIKEEDGVLKLSLNGYIGEEQLGIIAEDEYMRVNIVKKTIKYDTETYTIEFKNKTNNYIKIADNTQSNEVVLQVGNDKRKAQNLENGNIIVIPNYTYTREITFNKRFDTGEDATAVMFDAIRVLPEFSSNIDKAIKLYSLTINLQPNNK